MKSEPFVLQVSEQDRRLLLEACKLHREKFTNGYAMTLLMDRLEALPAAGGRCYGESLFMTRETEDRVFAAYEAASVKLGRRPTRCVMGRQLREQFAPFISDGHLTTACGVVIDFDLNAEPTEIRFE